MAYLIEGIRSPVIYCPNYHVGGNATARAILAAGGVPLGDHYSSPTQIPKGAVLVQTVRNHFDVIVSSWFKHKRLSDFNHYVQSILDGNHRFLGPNNFYSRFGNWDYILKYESLPLELSVLCNNVGISNLVVDLGEPLIPKGVSVERMFPYGLKEKIIDRYAVELEKIGYGVN